MIRERNFATYLLLSIITCGIYSIFFWYSYIEDLNIICNGDGEETPNYIVAFFLSLVTFGIYGFYYFYKFANRMQFNAPRYQVTLQENGTTILLFRIVGALVCGLGVFYADYLLIRNMNELAARYNANFSSTQQF